MEYIDIIPTRSIDFDVKGKNKYFTDDGLEIVGHQDNRIVCRVDGRNVGYPAPSFVHHYRK